MASARRLMVLFAMTAACGGGASQTPPSSMAPAPMGGSEREVPAEPTAAAPTDDAAAAPVRADDTPSTCDGPQRCAELGERLVAKGDRAGAMTALQKSCAGGVKVIDGCARLAAVLGEDASADPVALADAAHHGCSIGGSNETNRAIRGRACALWGTALRDGAGADKDADRAASAFTDGCKLGDRSACESAEEIRAREEAATGVPGANMRVGRITTDGVTVEDIACKSEGGGLGGLLGTLVLGKPFADRKGRLDACVKSRQTTRVRWTAANGRMTNVEVISGANPANACIQRALAGAPATVNGVCAASLEIGR